MPIGRVVRERSSGAGPNMFLCGRKEKLPSVGRIYVFTAAVETVR